MLEIVTRLGEKALHDQSLTTTEALAVLTAKGSQLTAYMAGAQQIKEHYFGPHIDLCSIINAKSGRCAENCSFCAQSAHHQTNAPVYALKSSAEIIAGAHKAAAEGNHCYGIVTSGTSVDQEVEFSQILAAIETISRETSIEPSASLGLLTADKAAKLAAAGCVTYHHNLETARSFFPHICTTHSYEEDVVTVKLAQNAGMRVCCGGIFGLGESLEQRIELGMTLRELNVDSVPLNFLNPVAGTPLEKLEQLTPLDCLRIITLYRYLLPRKRITICGGRDINLRDFQSAIFMAGASGTMIGDYLTTKGRSKADDLQMLRDAEVVINGGQD